MAIGRASDIWAQHLLRYSLDCVDCGAICCRVCWDGLSVLLKGAALRKSGKVQAKYCNQPWISILFLSVTHNLTLARTFESQAQSFQNTSQNNSTIIRVLISHYAEKTGT